MKTTTLFPALPLFLFIGLLLSCTPTQFIDIRTNPPQANVFIDNKYKGISPRKDTIKFKGGKTSAYIQITKDGYVDTTFYTRFNRKKDFRKTNRSFFIKLKPKDVITIELVSFEPIAGSAGVKLNKVITKSLAYLEPLERSPTVKSVQRITSNEEMTLQIGAPVISPTDVHLIYYIYTKDEQGTFHSNIWKQDVGSPSRTKITNGNKLDLFPAFSPGGKYIYFSSNRISQNPNVYKINALGGGGITSITNTQAEDYALSVSPLGNLVAYTSNPPTASEPQVWTITETGNLPTQLKEGQNPEVSPDGQTILFLKEDKKSLIQRGSKSIHPKQIWTMKLDGTNETQFSQNSTYDIIQAKWSPDGKWIVFSSDEGKDLRGNNNFDIWMMRSDATDKTQLTTNGSWDDSPAWSYDGKYIYFRSNRGGNWNLWRFEPIIE
ncbi:MAG: PD40 domain-containing protein [Bacteroidetes bacterium]|nr:PD40 domain-containing protein [Bacteroidota bacterium]